jgi:hypothetical protein
VRWHKTFIRLVVDSDAFCCRGCVGFSGRKKSIYASASLPSLPADEFDGGGGGNSNFVPSAIILWKPMLTPSMTASKTAHPIAPLRIARGPPRTASEPPVKKPAMMAFHGSSFFRTPLTAQSNVLNMPPQTPKLPPSTGARALIAVRAEQEKLSAHDIRRVRILHGINTSYPPFTVRAVAETFDAVPYCASYRL